VSSSNSISGGADMLQQQQQRKFNNINTDRSAGDVGLALSVDNSSADRYSDMPFSPLTHNSSLGGDYSKDEYHHQNTDQSQLSHSPSQPYSKDDYHFDSTELSLLEGGSISSSQQQQQRQYDVSNNKRSGMRHGDNKKTSDGSETSSQSYSRDHLHESLTVDYSRDPLHASSLDYSNDPLHASLDYSSDPFHHRLLQQEQEEEDKENGSYTNPSSSIANVSLHQYSNDPLHAMVDSVEYSNDELHLVVQAALDTYSNQGGTSIDINNNNNIQQMDSIDDHSIGSRSIMSDMEEEEDLEEGSRRRRRRRRKQRETGRKSKVADGAGLYQSQEFLASKRLLFTRINEPKPLDPILPPPENYTQIRSEHVLVNLRLAVSVCDGRTKKQQPTLTFPFSFAFHILLYRLFKNKYHHLCVCVCFFFLLLHHLCIHHHHHHHHHHQQQQQQRHRLHKEICDAL
jgi:hypothetical protein